MTTIPYSQPASIAYGNGTFVAVGYGSLVATSADGSHWSQQSLGANDGLFGVTFGGGAFVAVSTVGTAYKSTDGKTWTQARARRHLLRERSVCRRRSQRGRLHKSRWDDLDT